MLWSDEANGIRTRAVNCMSHGYYIYFAQPCENLGIIEGNWINSIGHNTHHDGEMGLGNHKDPHPRFDRKFLSYSDCDNKGQGNIELLFDSEVYFTNPSFAVPLNVKDVFCACKWSFGADKVKHGVSPEYLDGYRRWVFIGRCAYDKLMRIADTLPYQ